MELWRDWTGSGNAALDAAGNRPVSTAGNPAGSQVDPDRGRRILGRLPMDGVPGLFLGRLFGWLQRCWRANPAARPRRLALIERVALGPRQALALVEAEGTRLLVSVSPDGAPAFYALPRASADSGPAPARTPANSRSFRPAQRRPRRAVAASAAGPGRVSW